MQQPMVNRYVRTMWKQYAATKAPELRNSSPEEWDAWKFGEFEPRVLTDEPKDAAPVEIVLKRGIEVSGQLVDGKEKPIRGGPTRKRAMSPWAAIARA